jgi:hypothetical protein
VADCVDERTVLRRLIIARQVLDVTIVAREESFQQGEVVGMDGVQGGGEAQFPKTLNFVYVVLEEGLVDGF